MLGLRRYPQRRTPQMCLGLRRYPQRRNPQMCLQSPWQDRDSNDIGS